MILGDQALGRETLRMAELFKFRCYECQKLIGAPPIPVRLHREMPPMRG